MNIIGLTIVVLLQSAALGFLYARMRSHAQRLADIETLLCRDDGTDKPVCDYATDRGVACTRPATKLDLDTLWRVCDEHAVQCTEAGDVLVRIPAGRLQ